MVYSLINDEKESFFKFFGIFVICYYLIRWFYRFYNNFSTFFLSSGRVDFKKYGSWAVVTGCTDGIGKAYTELLAKEGLNIVLISRSKEKLEKQALDLKMQYSIQTKIVAADFTEPISIYPSIRSQLADLDIGVLFNNVGMVFGIEYFHSSIENEKNIDDIINCNIVSLTKMTAIVLPGMIQRKAGIIINNGSAAGRIPIPFMSLYSATKAYVDFFSRALNLEYKSKGIIFQSLCPCGVRTKLLLQIADAPMSQVLKLFHPSPEHFTKEAIKTIGTQSVTNGCLAHNIQGYIGENLLTDNLVYNIQLHEYNKQKKAKKE